MKIIISPAKKMNIQEDHPFEVTTPVFLEEAKELRKSLQTMDFKSLQSLWKCSEKLVRKNMEELLDSVSIYGAADFYDRTVEVCNRTSADFVWILWCFKTK